VVRLKGALTIKDTLCYARRPMKAVVNRTVLGQGIARVESVSKVTGTCTYAADVNRSDALWGGFCRSPFPHARLLNVDVSRAQRLPGVKAVITGKDVSPRLEGLNLQDQPIFARERVRYIGEKVAGVAAIDKDVVEEALELIDVEYEELPAVFDPLEAMKINAPILHPDYSTYRGSFKEPSLKNVRSAHRSSKGNIEEGWGGSDQVFENTFHTQMVHQGFIEPRAGVVEIDQQGRVGIWECQQAPFRVREWLAAHTDIPEERIVVHAVSTGGSFGGKLGYDDIIYIYYLARATGKPVKVVNSYTEGLLDGEPRHAAVITLRTGVKKDGRLWAWDGRIVYNGGAYGSRNPQNAMTGTFMLAGSYRTPHVRMEGLIVYTNQVPCGYFRAPGEVQNLYAVESHMDMMAEKLRLDPLEFRLRNVLREGDSQPNTKPLRDPRGREVLEQVSKVSRWRKTKLRPSKDGPNILLGRGLSLGNHHIGPGRSTAELFLEPDGSLRLVTSVRDVGVGAYTMHRQVVAEMLGVEPQLVQIDLRGTDTGVYDGGVMAQRGVHIEGRAVARAADSLIALLRTQAATLWEVEVDKVRWEKGRACLISPKKRYLDLKGLARLSQNGSLHGVGYCKDNSSDLYCFYAAVANVEVDKETGQVKIRQIHFALDVTRVINPIIHQGQIEGGVMQGVGFTLMENLVVDDGQVMTLNLGDYKIPNIRDIPELMTSLVKAKEGPGPFGTKAVAECGISIIAPAIANAVYDATGVRFMDAPITAEKVLEGRN